MSVIETFTNGINVFTLQFSEDEDEWKIYCGESLLLTLFDEDEAKAFYEYMTTASLFGEIVDMHISVNETENIAYGLVNGTDGRFVTFEIGDTFSLLFRGDEAGARARFNRCVTPALHIYLRLVEDLGGKEIKVRGRTYDLCTVLAKFILREGRVVIGNRWFVLNLTIPLKWDVVETPEGGFTTEAEGLQKFDELTLFK